MWGPHRIAALKSHKTATCRGDSGVRYLEVSVAAGATLPSSEALRSKAGNFRILGGDKRGHRAPSIVDRSIRCSYKPSWLSLTGAHSETGQERILPAFPVGTAVLCEK